MLFFQKFVLFLSGVLVSGPLLLSAQITGAIAPPSKTDTFIKNEKGYKFRVQHGELPAGNFQIAGVDLTAFGEVLDQAEKVLGKTPIKATGDAADYLAEACYRPVDQNDTTLLIIQTGEVVPSYILAADHSAWKWKTPCLPTNKVSRQIATASGIKIGLTQDEVIAILGLPTRRVHNASTGKEQLIYAYSMQKKFTARDFAWIRKCYPNKSEETIRSEYKIYDLWESITAKFVNNVLVRLEVEYSTTD